MPTQTRRIAVFITPHGYGHASRACAVLLALREKDPSFYFEIFTQTPPWFFNITLHGGFTYHDLYTDVGLVQDSVMSENLPATVQRLATLLPPPPAMVEQLALQVRDLGCEFVLCDIAPLGIRVAQAAGLRAIFEENFTWDWIYAGYVEEEPRLAPYIEIIGEIFSSADAHLRTEPACDYTTQADLTVNVVARKPRTPRAETRAQLGIAPDARVILLTMGGIGSQYPFLEALQSMPGVTFLVPGGSIHQERRGSLVSMAHHSNFYHPDLVEAADAVIGKLGYSTLAEAYHSGLPYAYIPRPRFRESPAMSGFVLENMHGIEISENDFYAGRWLDVVPRLLAIPQQRPTQPNGADQIAAFLTDMV